MWKCHFQFPIGFVYALGWRGKQGSSCESPGGRRACQHQWDSPEWLQTGSDLPSERLPQDPQPGGEKVGNQSWRIPSPLWVHNSLGRISHDDYISNKSGWQEWRLWIGLFPGFCRFETQTLGLVSYCSWVLVSWMVLFCQIVLKCSQQKIVHCNLSCSRWQIWVVL